MYFLFFVKFVFFPLFFVILIGFVIFKRQAPRKRFKDGSYLGQVTPDPVDAIVPMETISPKDVHPLILEFDIPSEDVNSFSNQRKRVEIQLQPCSYSNTL